LLNKFPIETDGKFHLVNYNIFRINSKKEIVVEAQGFELKDSSGNSVDAISHFEHKQFPSFVTDLTASEKPRYACIDFRFLTSGESM